MNLTKNLEIGALILYSKLFRKRIPLFVSWALTHRCNYQCIYCDSPLFKTKELATKQVFKIIDELAEMKCRVVVFTGGEPLLRDDIGKIVDYCKKKGFYVSIDSNGVLVNRKIDEIKNIDLLQLSLDGPKEIHDMQRGKGSYDRVMEAIKIARDNGLDLTLNATITKYNCSYDTVDYILSIAKKYNVKARFQPVVDEPLANKNVRDLYISLKMQKKIIEYILKKKKESNIIENTTSSLNYFKSYPNNDAIKCGALKINCLINPRGDIYPCTYIENKIKPYNSVELGFKEAFIRSKPVDCDSCLCNKTLDLSKFFSFDILAMIDIIKSRLR